MEMLFLVFQGCRISLFQRKFNDQDVNCYFLLGRNKKFDSEFCKFEVKIKFDFKDKIKLIKKFGII